MNYAHLLILTNSLFLLSSCTAFDSRQPAQDPVGFSPKPLVLPVGKNWQVIEEAPKLSDEQGRLPFQTEQSVQPEGAKPASAAENRKIETPQ